MLSSLLLRCFPTLALAAELRRRAWIRGNECSLSLSSSSESPRQLEKTMDPSLKQSFTPQEIGEATRIVHRSIFGATNNRG
jgi:hypothetical protein